MGNLVEVERLSSAHALAYPVNQLLCFSEQNP
jgi:hypothetical protein